MARYAGFFSCFTFLVPDETVFSDQEYVLINYKTEPCKKPPRLCRQGYACPYYHNSKDKRRAPTAGPISPAANGQQQNGNAAAAVANGNASNGTTTALSSVKYRSTPCPNVKHGDEWGDPEICESGDNCAYCHTRTEQQFHPEVSVRALDWDGGWTSVGTGIGTV